MRYCAVHGCSESSRKSKERKFHSFPANEARCRRWIEAIGRKDLESKNIKAIQAGYYVCDLHFYNSDRAKKNLKKHALPKLFAVEQEQNNEASCLSKYTQTELVPICNVCNNSCAYAQVTTIKSEFLSQSPCQFARNCQLGEFHRESELKSEYPFTSQIVCQCTNSPRWKCTVPNTSRSTQTTKLLAENIPLKKKLLLELKTERKKRRLLEALEVKRRRTEAMMSPLLLKIIDAQKANINKHKSNGNRYDPDYIKFALNIYCASPTAYQMLSKVLCMPDRRTLQRLKLANSEQKPNIYGVGLSREPATRQALNAADINSGGIDYDENIVTSNKQSSLVQGELADAVHSEQANVVQSESLPNPRQNEMTEQCIFSVLEDIRHEL